jgi:hypothetical protein
MIKVEDEDVDDDVNDVKNINDKNGDDDETETIIN